MRFFTIITPRSLIPWLAQVDRGRINMTAQENIDYFNIESFVKHEIMEVDDKGEGVQDY